MQLRGEDRTSVTELQNLLRQTAEVYRSLVQHAKAASVPVPSEAQLGTGVKRGPDQLEYDEFAAANATDWDDFQDEGARPETTGWSCLYVTMLGGRMLVC